MVPARPSAGVYARHDWPSNLASPELEATQSRPKRSSRRPVTSDSVSPPAFTIGVHEVPSKRLRPPNFVPTQSTPSRVPRMHSIQSSPSPPPVVTVVYVVHDVPSNRLSPPPCVPNHRAPV